MIATQSCLLLQYPILHELPAADRAGLLAAASVVHLPAETVMFDENQPCQEFPLLLSGNIRVIKAAPNGRELQIMLTGTLSTCVASHASWQLKAGN